MRLLTTLPLLAVALTACTHHDNPFEDPEADAFEHAPANGFEATMWEYDVVTLPMSVVPSWVTLVQVEVQSCVEEGNGDLYVETPISSERIFPDDCASGVSVDRFWLETRAPHDAWFEVTPLLDFVPTTIWASVEIIGW